MPHMHFEPMRAVSRGVVTQCFRGSMLQYGPSLQCQRPVPKLGNIEQIRHNLRVARSVSGDIVLLDKCPLLAKLLCYVLILMSLKNHGSACSRMYLERQRLKINSALWVYM